MHKRICNMEFLHVAVAGMWFTAGDELQSGLTASNGGTQHLDKNARPAEMHERLCSFDLSRITVARIWPAARHEVQFSSAASNDEMQHMGENA